MRPLGVFNNVSLDGYFCDRDGGMQWAHNVEPDPEFGAFVQENAKGGGVLLLGRVTYEMMASFWPTPAAAAMNPELAERMNAMPKFVASRTLSEVSWANSTLLQGDLVEAVRALKAEEGPGITILGSGSLVVPLTEAGLIDSYQVVVNPVVLGGGRTMFDGLEGALTLRRVESRAFGNGSWFGRYERS